MIVVAILDIGAWLPLFDECTVPTVIVLTISLVFAYSVARIVYVLTIHPLADVPGPKICAVTRIPYWIAYWNGTDVHWIRCLHEKYGPIVHYGPFDVSFISAQAWKDIYGQQKGGKELSKARDFSVQPVNGVPSMLSASIENHTRVRRLFSPAFSERALRGQEPLFKQYADLLVSKLLELGVNGKPVEMTRLFNFTTFDVMAELCFGHSLELLTRNEFSPWVASIFHSLEVLPIVSFISYYPLLDKLLTRFEPRSITAQREAHCKHSADRVNQRLKEGSDRPDIFNLALQAQDTEQKLSVEEMHSNAEIFMFAGSETTATLLSGLTYHLLLHPDKHARIVSEVRGAFRSRQEITFDALVDMRYLSACVREGLRVYPPIPPGTRVSVHQYAAYRAPAHFADPDAFAPERWLGENPRYEGDERDVHQPFLVGPRNCIGQNMAMHEMRLLFATLIWEFDLELCEESRGWSEQKAFGLWKKNALLCRVKPVESA
ncbi:cytochrome P450 [Xylariaceae sp. FL0016]|nr:cytochrome P450 [Xylariaceae sp. FL0016]